MKLFTLSLILFLLTLAMWISRAYLLERYADVYQTLQECQKQEKVL